MNKGEIFIKNRYIIIYLQILILNKPPYECLKRNEMFDFNPDLHRYDYLQIVICSALGFDTYLVMRHGVKSDTEEEEDVPLSSYHSISGDQLGCYFCNDVVAPGNVCISY